MEPFDVVKRTEALSPGVRAYAFDYPKGHHIEPHLHDWEQLIYARAGVMTVMTAAGACLHGPRLQRGRRRQQRWWRVRRGPLGGARRGRTDRGKRRRRCGRRWQSGHLELDSLGGCGLP
jgi:hypothetical protein